MTRDLLRPRVLVLMATYNGMQWIDEQIQSIIVQEGVDIHLCISDDCSTDLTGVHIKNAYANNSRVEIILNSSPSGSAGSNFQTLFRSVNTSSFNYISLADQDDIWHPRKLIEAVKVLQSEGAKGYSGAVNAFFPSGKKVLLKQSNKLRSADFLFEGAGQGCTFVVTSDMFDVIKNFCIRNRATVENFHYHDWLIYLITRAAGYKWCFDKRPWVLYRQHDKNEIGARAGMGAIAKRFELIKNGWYKRQINMAIKLAALVNPENLLLSTIISELNGKSAIKRKLKFSKILFQYGRRRLSDRAVLIYAAILGYI